MTRLRQIALEATKKKLIGKRLSYQEYCAIIKEIVHGEISDIITAYFVAAGFTKGFKKEELYYFVKAMVDTGDRLNFGEVVADKHSVGGIPGYRTTLIVVPIISASGFVIPKTSSRAITSPAGSADVMEVLANVSYSSKDIRKIVKKVGACIVWGGAFSLVPADNKIIKIGKALSFDCHDKVIASVMAKKIAAGATRLVIDIPYGEGAKIKNKSDADSVGKKFTYIAKRFKVKLAVEKTPINWPIGNGIGPLLEARDCLRVLQQKDNRPKDLEKRALKLAESLLKLCGKERGLAKKVLVDGRAFEKMKEIIAAQGGNPNIDSEDLEPGRMKYETQSTKNGIVQKIENKNIRRLCQILGTPEDKKAGIYINKKIGERINKNETLLYLYSSDKTRLEEAQKEIKRGLGVYEIG